MSERVDSLYICPWSLRDPLCQSQSLAYIRGLVNSGYKFALITFETAQYRLDEAQVAEQKRDLLEQGIYWYPVDWPSGISLSQKLSGIWSVVLQGIKVCRRHRPRIIHSRTSLPVFAAVALKKLFRTKFLYDADSLLSQEYLDIGHLTVESRAYTFLAKSEKWGRDNADHVIVLTNRLRDVYLQEFGVKLPVDVIPCCVDTDRFRFDPQAREKLRKELGIDGEVVLTYVGKTGSWYLVEETFEFFKTFNDLFPTSRLLIVSRDDPQVFHRVATQAAVERDLYFVRAADHADIPKWLSASDVSLSLIKQVSSKIGSSPVKFAEYLSVGLPVVSTDNIGDCSTVIEEGNVGAVLEQAGVESYDVAGRKVLDLLGEDKAHLSARCVNVAGRHFSIRHVGITKYIEIYKALNGSKR